MQIRSGAWAENRPAKMRRGSRLSTCGVRRSQLLNKKVVIIAATAGEKLIRAALKLGREQVALQSNEIKDAQARRTSPIWKGRSQYGVNYVACVCRHVVYHFPE